MDLIKVISEVEVDKIENSDFWAILVAIFGEKANKRQFFYGHRVGPLLEDLELILRQLNRFEKLEEQVDRDTWDQMGKVLRFLLQKSLNSVENEIEKQKERHKFTNSD